MKKNIIFLTVFSMIILTGCTQKEDNHVLESKIESLEIENTKLNDELTKSLTKIEDLNKEISDLKKQSKIYNETESNSSKELKLLRADKDRAFYIIEESNINGQSISIIGNNADKLVESYDEVMVDGVGNGEIFKVKVIGSIYDFRLIEVKYDNEINDFVEDKVLHHLDEVRNQSVVIETYFPEGMPNEKIKWLDETGKANEVFLSYDGYGFNGSIIWSR